MSVITLTAKPQDNSRIQFYFGDEEGTLTERLRVEVETKIDRSDEKVENVSMNIHVDDDISTFSEGDAATLRGLLLKLYNESIKDI